MMVRPLAGERRSKEPIAGGRAAAAHRRAAGIRLERAFDLRAGRGEVPQRRLQPGGVPRFVVPSRELDDARGGGQRVVEAAELRAGVGDDLIEDERALVGNTRHRRESASSAAADRRSARSMVASSSRVSTSSGSRTSACASNDSARAGSDRATCGGVGTIEVGAAWCRARPRVRAAAPRRRAPPASSSKCARDSTSARSSGRSRASAIERRARFIRAIGTVRQQIGGDQPAFEAAGRTRRPGRADLWRLIGDAKAREPVAPHVGLEIAEESPSADGQTSLRPSGRWARRSPSARESDRNSVDTARHSAACGSAPSSANRTGPHARASCTRTSGGRWQTGERAGAAGAAQPAPAAGPAAESRASPARGRS